MNIRVEHVKRAPKGEYIGRSMPGRQGSALSNPYHIGKDGDREQVIALYRSWLSKQLTERNMSVICEVVRLFHIARQGELTLLCWCAPMPCHGDVIKEVLEGMGALL